MSRSKSHGAVRGPARLTLEALEGRCLPTTYSLTYLGTLGGMYSWAYAINNAGQVVGKSDVASSTHAHAYLYRAGAMTDLGTLGGDESEAYAINNHGDVVGAADATPGQFSRHAFLYHNGALTDLNALGATYSFAYDINDAGQVVGDLVYDNGQQQTYHGFLYQNGVLTDLGAPGGSYCEAYGINTSGQVAGTATFASGMTHAFLESGGTFTDLGTLPGGQFSQAYGLNDAGQVVGWADTDSGFDRHAFLYDNGAMADLGTLGGDFSLASHINAAGQVVGWSYVDSQDSVMRGYVASDGTMTDLNHLIAPHAEYVVNVADGINDQGVIVGTGQRGPFPGSYALLLTPNRHQPPQRQPLPGPTPVQLAEPPALPTGPGEVPLTLSPAPGSAVSPVPASPGEQPSPVVATPHLAVQEMHSDQPPSLADPLGPEGV